MPGLECLLIADLSIRDAAAMPVATGSKAITRSAAGDAGGLGGSATGSVCLFGKQL